jgi:hypothetical protein
MRARPTFVVTLPLFSNTDSEPVFRKLGRKLPLAMQFAENAVGSRTLGRLAAQKLAI